MMRLGSVILKVVSNDNKISTDYKCFFLFFLFKVESKCVADQMWYFPLLKPFYDHVPVKADLRSVIFLTIKNNHLRLCILTI